MMRKRVLVLGVVALATLLYGCGRGNAPAEKHHEREAARPAETTPRETTASEQPAPTRASGAERAARVEADCRLVLYVAKEDMTRKEAKAFSELLADMIRTMESPSWTVGDLRNAALDHLAVPRYPECKAGEK